MKVVFPILFSLRNGGAYFCSLCSKLVSFCIDNPFHFFVVEKRIKGANTDGCLASAPREFHPHAVLARPYLLPATPRHLNMVARSGCSCKGVSLSCLCVVARRLPNLLHVLVFLARSLGRSWRTVRMARHKQIVSVCPMPAGNYPPGVLVKELRQPARKGGLTGASCALIQVKAQDGDNQFRFQPSTQFFINISAVVAVLITACPSAKRS